MIPIVGTVTNTYAAKFICGVQPDASLQAVPDAQAGHYSTKINVHNNTGVVIKFRKKIIQLKGGQVPIAPACDKVRRIERQTGRWKLFAETSIVTWGSPFHHWFTPLLISKGS